MKEERIKEQTIILNETAVQVCQENGHEHLDNIQPTEYVRIVHPSFKVLIYPKKGHSLLQCNGFNSL